MKNPMFFHQNSKRQGFKCKALGVLRLPLLGPFLVGGWTNPFQTYAQVKMGNLPQFSGWKFQNYLKPSPRFMLPETNKWVKTPENRPKRPVQGDFIWTNHPFSGAKMLVSGRLSIFKWCFDVYGTGHIKKPKVFVTNPSWKSLRNVLHPWRKYGSQAQLEFLQRWLEEMGSGNYIGSFIPHHH